MVHVISSMHIIHVKNGIKQRGGRKFFDKSIDLCKDLNALVGLQAVIYVRFSL